MLRWQGPGSVSAVAGRHAGPLGGSKTIEPASLFDTRLIFRAAIDAVFEGRCGSVTAAPDCARLDLGPFSMLGSEPTSVDARSLLTGITFPRIFVDCSAWHALIREHNMNCRFELEGRTQFSPDQLDDERLRNLRSVPREMRLVPLDAALLRAALDHLSTDLLIEAVFADPETFVSAGGFGFAVVQEDRVLAAATSAIVSDRHIEIQINTAPEQQRKGLATAVGAAIALASRARGLEPGWDTGSPGSAGLARKLGFRVAREHEWLCVDRPTA